jgi:hypothetical protein
LPNEFNRDYCFTKLSAQCIRFTVDYLVVAGGGGVVIIKDLQVAVVELVACAQQ